MNDQARRMREFLALAVEALDRGPGAIWPAWSSAARVAPVAIGVAAVVAGCHGIGPRGAKYGGPPPPEPSVAEPVPPQGSPPGPATADRQHPPASFPGASQPAGPPSPEPSPDLVADPDPPDSIAKYAAPMPPEAAPKYGVPIETQPVEPDLDPSPPGRKYGAPPPPGGVEALYAMPF